MKEESLLLLSDLQKLINQVVLIDYTIIILEGNIMWNDSLLRGDLYINRNPRHERQVHYFFQDNNIIRRFIKYYRLRPYNGVNYN